MLIALGFLVASLIGVLLAPSLWNRAARLSKKRLEGTLPLTLSEIEATQDQLRASYAVRLRRLETSLAGAKQKAANQLVDNSRLHMQIVALKDQIGDLELRLSERRNAATVLEQTITKRFPELDREITAAKAQLQERSYELQDLTNRLARRDEELDAAERAAASYQEELKRLHQVLEKSAADRSGRRVRRASQWDIDDYRAEYDRLNLELSKLRQQLSQFEDRDAQQVGVIKGELQKLAEQILASAQPKPPPLQTEWSEPSKRLAGQDARRERPLPWKQNSPPMPLAARLKLNAGQAQDNPAAASPAPASSQPADSDSLAARGEAGSQSASPVLTILPEDAVLSSAPKNGHGDGSVRSKMLYEAVPGKKDGAREQSGDVRPGSEPEEPVHAAVNGAGAEKENPVHRNAAAANGASPEPHGGFVAGGASAAPDAPAIPEKARNEAGEASGHDAGSSPAENGARRASFDNGSPAEPSLADAINLDALQPETGQDKKGVQHATLIERLRGIGEEPEANDSAPSGLRR
jgi:hypothetical protein